MCWYAHDTDRGKSGAGEVMRFCCRLAGEYILILAIGFLGCGAAVEAATDDEIGRARQALAGLGLQLDLPRAPEPESWHFNLPPQLLWAVVILGAALLLYFFLREVIPGLILSSRGAAWDRDAVPGDVPPAPEAAARAAEQLAREGRFAEAMHVLLFDALAALRRRDQIFAESLTSREILRRARLSPQGQASLRDIVARVEWSHFGEHTAGVEDYRRCRDSFDRLTLALQEAPGA